MSNQLVLQFRCESDAEVAAPAVNAYSAPIVVGDIGQTYVSGVFNNSISLPALSLSDSIGVSSFPRMAKGTVEAWFRPNWDIVAAFLNVDHYLLGYVNNNNLDAENTIIFWFNSNTGGLSVYLYYDNAGNSVYFDFTSFDITASTWSHIALTWEGTLYGNFISLYFNGVLQETFALTANPDSSLGEFSFANPETTPTVGFDGLIDNLKIYNYAKTDFSDRYNEFAGITIEQSPINQSSPQPQILFLNSQIDLYALGYASDSVDITETKTFQQAKLLENQLSINVKNYDDTFSADNPKSIISGIDFLYQPLIVNDTRGIKVWDGIITDISRDHNSKMATIVSDSMMTKWQNINIAYTSSGYETPATAIYNIFLAYGFTNYDNASLQRSIGILTNNNCYCKVRIALNDNVNFFSAIEKISEYACAYAYSSKGNVYIKHYEPFTGGVSANIQMSDIISAPTVTNLFNNIINDYRIGYVGCGDIPVTDTLGNNIGAISRTRYNTHQLPEMVSDDKGQIQFKDITSAMYIGECYIKRSHRTLSTAPRPLYQITFSLSYDFYNYIELGTFFNITFTDEAWTLKTFEVFSISSNITNYQIEITAIEVDI